MFLCAYVLVCNAVYVQYIIQWKLKTNICASSWWTGEWSECSRSCNGGLRTREVLCKRRISGTEEKVLDDSACTPLRPSLTEPCSNHSCPPEWLALDWSEVGRRLPSHACGLRALPQPILGFSAEFFSDEVIVYFSFEPRNPNICQENARVPKS